jgi:iron complex outermembrane recepter protein
MRRLTLFAKTVAAILTVLSPAAARAASPAAPTAASIAALVDSLRGVVRDSAGQPIDGATVTLPELGRTTGTSRDGTFAFGGVPAGRYTLVVRRLGFATAGATVEVPVASPIVIAMQVSALRLEPVTVTGTRAPGDPLKSPLPISDLGAERLRRDESVSLAHALDGLAGVRDISTGQQVGQPVIRGLSGPSVLVLDGGMRLEDYSWSTEDGPSVDPRLADNVEVIRGPASVLYGSNAIGGVMNVIDRDVPEARGLPSFMRAGGEVYGATNNSEFGGILSLEGAQGAFGWLATVVGRKADNFQTPPGNPQTPTGDIYDTQYNAVNGDIALGLHGETSNGTLRFAHYGGNFGLLDGPPVPDDNTGGPLRKLSDNRVQFTSSSLVGAGRLEVSAQYQSHWLEEVVGDSRTDDAPPPIELQLNTSTADVLLHHAQGEWLTGTVGASGMYQTNHTMGVDPLVPNATVWDASLFAFEQATKGRWSGLVGLRGDLGQTSADSNATLMLGAQTRQANAVTGDVGAVYRPVPQMAIAFNVGRAYQAPTLQQLFAHGPLPAEGEYVIGLPTAVPMVSFDLDASVRWQTPTLTAQLAVYRNQVNNYLYLQATGDSITGPSGEGDTVTLAVYQQMQTSHALLTGLDFSVEWAALPMLSFRGRFDMVNGTNEATGEPLSLMPPPRGDIEAEIHTPGTRALYFFVGTHIVGTQTRLGPFDTPTSAYTLLELGGGAAHDFGGRSYHLDVRVTNAANLTYTDFLSRYKTFAYAPSRNFIFRLSTPM